MARQQIVSQGTGGIVRRGGIITRPTAPPRREIIPTGTYGLSRKGKVVTAPVTRTPPPNAVLLGTGEYIGQSDFDKLTNAEQAYLKKFGIDKFNKEQERVAAKRIEAISTYKEGEGYDIVKMVSAGYSAERLRELGFDDDGIKEAQRLSSTLTQLQEYKTRDGYNLYKAVAEGKVASDTLSEVFGRDIVETTQGTIRELSKYESNGGYDLGKMLQDGYATDRLEQLGFSTQGIIEAREFEAQHIKLGSGEYISKEEWAKLDKKAQDYIMTYGFEKGYERYNAEFEAANIKLDSGEYISKEEWAKLDTKAQDYVKTHGVEKYNATIPEPSEDKGWFRNTVNYLRQALTVDESILTGQIFGIKNPGLERAAAQVNKIFEVFAPQVETKLADDPKGFFVETGKVVASYMPFVWAVNWRGMSAESLIINGAIDAIILVSFGLGQGLSKLKARPIVNAATKAGKAADNMKLTLRKLAKTSVTNTTKYARASSNAQKAIQASKVADAKFIVQLEKVKSLTSKQLKILEKASGIKGLRKAILDVSKAQTQLKKAWGKVSVYRVGKAGVYSLEEVGGRKYLAQMAKVKDAQARLAKALATFDTKLKPRYKFTTSPEFKGFAVEWRQKILPTYSGGQPVVAPLSGGKGVQLAVLEKTAPKVSLKSVFGMKLKPVYKTAGEVTKRVIPPAVKTASKVATVAVAGAAIARKVGTTPVVKTITKEAQRQVAKTITKEAQRQAAKITTRVPSKVAVEQIIREATRQAVDLSITARSPAQVRIMVEVHIREMIMELPVEAMRQELQQESVVRILTKVATALATKIITKIKLKGKLWVPFPDSAVSIKKKTKEPIYPKGTIVWKQGSFWRGIPPPYKQVVPITTRKPPEGAVRTGQKTPQETLQIVGKSKATVPKTVSVDLGVSDIFISEHGKKIAFTGKGMETVVGKSLPETSRGMSIPAIKGSRKKYPKGSVAWKQGFIYTLIYPPYGAKDILYSKKPFKGVKTLKGAESAYKTIIKEGGEVPLSIKRDMGIMDIEIKTPAKGKPTLLFRADIKQETWRGRRKKPRRVVNARRTNRRRFQQTAAAI